MNEKTWALTETGTTFHSFDGDYGVCRKNMKVGTAQHFRTREAAQHAVDTTRVGFTMCKRCVKLEDEHLARVEASMEPVNPYDQECEGIVTSRDVAEAQIAKLGLSEADAEMVREGLRNCPPEELVELFPTNTESKEDDTMKMSGPLTENQHKVMDLLITGHDRTEIAERLGLSKTGVSENLRAAVAKMGCRSSWHAAAQYSKATALRTLADGEIFKPIENPCGEAEEHMNQVLNTLAGVVRADAAKLVP